MFLDQEEIWTLDKQAKEGEITKTQSPCRKFVQYEDAEKRDIYQVGSNELMASSPVDELTLWHDGEEWRINSINSFNSKDAIKAEELLSKYRMNKTRDHYTLSVKMNGDNLEVSQVSNKNTGKILAEESLEMVKKHTQLL